jgi:hypothetical protein
LRWPISIFFPALAIAAPYPSAASHLPVRALVTLPWVGPLVIVFVRFLRCFNGFTAAPGSGPASSPTTREGRHRRAPSCTTSAMIGIDSICAFHCVAHFPTAAWESVRKRNQTPSSIRVRRHCWSCGRPPPSPESRPQKINWNLAILPAALLPFCANLNTRNQTTDAIIMHL